MQPTTTTLVCGDKHNSPFNRLASRSPVSYMPFGLTRTAIKVSTGFNGERLEESIGAYLLGQGYRVYSPSLMRFHSPDSFSPFGLGGLNAYAYVCADPINFIDPSGHVGESLRKVVRKILRPRTSRASNSLKTARPSRSVPRFMGLNASTDPAAPTGQARIQQLQGMEADARSAIDWETRIRADALKDHPTLFGKALGADTKISQQGQRLDTVFAFAPDHPALPLYSYIEDLKDAKVSPVVSLINMAQAPRSEMHKTFARRVVGDLVPSGVSAGRGAFGYSLIPARTLYETRRLAHALNSLRR